MQKFLKKCLPRKKLHCCDHVFTFVTLKLCFFLIEPGLTNFITTIACGIVMYLFVMREDHGSFLRIGLREAFEFGEGFHPLYSQFLLSSTTSPFQLKKKKKTKLLLQLCSYLFLFNFTSVCLRVHVPACWFEVAYELNF